MRKKHFVAIARELAVCRPDENPYGMAGWRLAVGAVVKACVGMVPGFQTDSFMRIAEGEGEVEREVAGKR